MQSPFCFIGNVFKPSCHVCPHCQFYGRVWPLPCSIINPAGNHGNCPTAKRAKTATTTIFDECESFFLRPFISSSLLCNYLQLIVHIVALIKAQLLIYNHCHSGNAGLGPGLRPLLFRVCHLHFIIPGDFYVNFFTLYFDTTSRSKPLLPNLYISLLFYKVIYIMALQNDKNRRLH